ncbi:MAG: hydroxymethylbilane synthase [Pseudomonadota bacterium]
MPDPIRLATRKSPLALKQAEMVRDALLAQHPTLEPDQVTLLPLTSTGDQIQDRTLQEAGGKGLFTKEIEEAVIEGRAELAVHSMKDMPPVSPPGLVIDCFLPREDPRDALISLAYPSFELLPEGAVIGTASVRRQALIKRLRPDVLVVPFRGNVQTRLAKLAAGEVDATFLAVAGLTRLGATEHITTIMEIDAMLPAVGQGIIGIQRRDDDDRMANYLAPINCPDAHCHITAERAMLAVLDGSCRTPIAGYATDATQQTGDARVSAGAAANAPSKDTLYLRGSVTHPNGQFHQADGITGPRDQAATLGQRLGEALREHLPKTQTPD